MALAAPGVGSNLDVNNIVSQLMSIERQPVAALDSKEASFQAKLSAYGVLRSALSSFQGALSSLTSASRAASFAATSSDANVLSAAAAGNPTLGSYSLEVEQLAQRQSLVAGGQPSSSAAIGSGAATTITFEFGKISGGTQTDGVYAGATFSVDGTATGGSVTIDASNNSLQGIRDAINNANLGIKASIVKDGSATPYRLVLQPAASGASRSIRINASGDPALAALLAHDPSGTQNLRETIAAQDAELLVNGVQIASSSNSVDGAIEGVTLTLLKEGTSTLDVSRDTAPIKKAIEGFVKAYNELDSGVRSLTKYDPQTKRGGALLGDGAARAIQSQLRAALGARNQADGPSIDTLAEIGVSFQRDGSLSLDSAKLDKALASDYAAVAALFGSSSRASDSLINIASSGTRTKPGTYAVTVTTLPAQGKLVGDMAAGLTITQGLNDQLSITVDGTVASVTLAAGTYTASALADTLQSAINSAPSLQTAGSKVTVTENAGVLTVRSERYGSSSAISASGNAASTLFGNSPVASPGADVAGTINGLPASGSGQRLSGQPGTDTDGLVLEVTGGLTGSRGVVTVTGGYGKVISEVVDGFLSSTGLLSSRTEGINRSIQDIGKRRDALNTRLDDIEKRYRAQFTALDSLISSMNATSAFLTQQLAKLSNTN